MIDASHDPLESTIDTNSDEFSQFNLGRVVEVPFSTQAYEVADFIDEFID